MGILLPTNGTDAIDSFMSYPFNDVKSIIIWSTLKKERNILIIAL